VFADVFVTFGFFRRFLDSILVFLVFFLETLFFPPNEGTTLVRFVTSSESVVPPFLGPGTEPVQFRVILGSWCSPSPCFSVQGSPGVPLEFTKGLPKCCFGVHVAKRSVLKPTVKSAQKHGGYVKSGLCINRGRLKTQLGSPRGRPGVNDGPHQVLF